MSDSSQNPVRMGPQEQADMTPRICRIDQHEDDVREWAREARGRWGVPVQVFQRSLSCGGVSTFVWVAVIWPKRSKGKEKP